MSKNIQTILKENTEIDISTIPSNITASDRDKVLRAVAGVLNNILSDDNEEVLKNKVEEFNKAKKLKNIESYTIRYKQWTDIKELPKWEQTQWLLNYVMNKKKVPNPTKTQKDNEVVKWTFGNKKFTSLEFIDYIRTVPYNEGDKGVKVIREKLKIYSPLNTVTKPDVKLPLELVNFTLAKCFQKALDNSIERLEIHVKGSEEKPELTTSYAYAENLVSNLVSAIAKHWDEAKTRFDEDIVEAINSKILELTTQVSTMMFNEVDVVLFNSEQNSCYEYLKDPFNLLKDISKNPLLEHTILLFYFILDMLAVAQPDLYVEMLVFILRVTTLNTMFTDIFYNQPDVEKLCKVGPDKFIEEFQAKDINLGIRKTESHLIDLENGGLNLNIYWCLASFIRKCQTVLDREDLPEIYKEMLKSMGKEDELEDAPLDVILEKMGVILEEQCGVAKDTTITGEYIRDENTTISTRFINEENYMWIVGVGAIKANYYKLFNIEQSNPLSIYKHLDEVGYWYAVANCQCENDMFYHVLTNHNNEAFWEELKATYAEYDNVDFSEDLDNENILPRLAANNLFKDLTFYKKSNNVALMCNKIIQLEDDVLGSPVRFDKIHEICNTTKLDIKLFDIVDRYKIGRLLGEYISSFAKEFMHKADEFFMNQNKESNEESAEIVQELQTEIETKDKLLEEYQTANKEYQEEYEKLKIQYTQLAKKLIQLNKKQ